MKLEQMMKDWNALMYVFLPLFLTLNILTSAGAMSSGCTHKVCWFLNKGDKALTRNMCKHVWLCWGKIVMNSICGAKNLAVAWHEITEYTNKESIIAAVKLKGKGKVAYWHFHIHDFTSFNSGPPEYLCTYTPLN